MCDIKVQSVAVINIIEEKAIKMLIKQASQSTFKALKLYSSIVQRSNTLENANFDRAFMHTHTHFSQQTIFEQQIHDVSLIDISRK